MMVRMIVFLNSSGWDSLLAGARWQQSHVSRARLLLCVLSAA
jgi:hypothetical protein